MMINLLINKTKVVILIVKKKVLRISGNS